MADFLLVSAAALETFKPDSGTGLDTFNFIEGFSVSGSIDGGDITTQNNIRFNTYATRLSLRLGMPVAAS